MNFNGNLRIAECDENGIVTGPWLGLLNPVKCELQTPAAENVDEVSRLIASAGQLLSRGQIPKFTALALSTSSLRDKRMLALAFNGTAVAFSQSAVNYIHQASATVTHEAKSSTAFGVPIQLANKSVSGVVVTDAATDGTTYVVNTDYTVDALNGTITPLSGGAIGATEALHISYAAAALEDEQVTATERGDWIKLAHRHVTVSYVKNAARSTTYVLGTDYAVDSQPGFIKPLPGGAITANEVLKVGYQAAALTGTTVQGSTVPSKLVRVEIQLADLVDQSESYFVCPLYQAASAGNKDIFGKAVINADLAGAMLVPPEGTAIATETGGAPYTFTSL